MNKLTVRAIGGPTAVVDYVNLVELRGVCNGRVTHVAGTLYGKQAAPRIVGIDEHIVDVPPSSHMLVVRNADVTGMIGRVTTILGDAGVNIDDMDVGKTAEGEAALMALSTKSSVPDDIVTAIRNESGVNDARAIELG